jgi:hypothetical protein
MAKAQLKALDRADKTIEIIMTTLSGGGPVNLDIRKKLCTDNANPEKKLLAKTYPKADFKKLVDKPDEDCAGIPGFIIFCPEGVNRAKTLPPNRDTFCKGTLLDITVGGQIPIKKALEDGRCYDFSSNFGSAGEPQGYSPLMVSPIMTCNC